MTPGLSDNLQKISDAQKAALISNELCRLRVDIIALQETRLTESGIIWERDYSFFWQAKAADETRVHGVGFAIKNNLLGSIIPPSEETWKAPKVPTSDICRVSQPNQCLCFNINLCIRIEG